jgi:Peptidase family M1 domain
MVLWLPLHSPPLRGAPPEEIMRTRLALVLVFLAFCGNAVAQDLATAPSDQLLGVYKQLRSLEGSTQSAVTDNVVFSRDSGTFTFQNGRLTFAAPVAGHVVAANFQGTGTFRLDPPDPLDQHQIARYTQGPDLTDTFNQAVFFFTDDSFQQLQSLTKIGEGGDAAGATKAISDVEKRFQQDFNGWWSNAAKGNPVVRNLAARILADLADPSSRGFFLAYFKGAHAGDLMFCVSWNRNNFLLSDIPNGDEVMLLHLNPGNYFEWLAGFHLREEYAKSPHPDHRTLVAHCSNETIDLDVTKDRHIAATATMGFQVNEGTPRVLPMNLEGVLRVSSIEDGNGKKLDFIQEARDLDSDLWLILAAPSSPGTQYQAKITYEEDSTRDSRIIDRQGSGLYFVGSRASWFPSFGAADDRTNFTLDIQSPKKYTMVATGSRDKMEKGKNYLETEWKSQIPFNVVGFNYGEFVEKDQSDPQLTVAAYGGKEVPDELKGLQSSYDMASLAAGPNGSNPTLRGGAMTGGFDTASNTKYAAAVSYNALKLYESYFGVLPFKTVSVTEQPVRGFGQSWPTLIYLPYDSLLDSTTRQSLGFQDSPEAREFYNIVAVHEMAHQWWGHMVGIKTYHDAWLSEGFAEFSASLYLRQFDRSKLSTFWNLKRKWLLSKNPAGHRPVDVGPIWLSAQLPSYHEPDLYRNLIYDKGAYVMEMLRTIMWDSRQRDPDTAFINMMRDFVTTYAGKNASTADFQRIVEKHTGQSMDWFFNEWVYGTEIPTYSLTYDLKDAGGGKTQLSLSVTQSGVSDSFTMKVPVDIVVGNQVRRLGLMEIKGPRTMSANIVLPMRPDKVELDAEKSILCTVQ